MIKYKSIYRAMCDKEADITLRRGYPQYQSTNKWFSEDLEHIKNRVQDGQFNKAGFKKRMYARILEFIIPVEHLSKFKISGINELMLNKNNEKTISWINVREVL